MAVMDGCESQHRTSVLKREYVRNAEKRWKSLLPAESLQKILSAPAAMYFRQRKRFL